MYKAISLFSGCGGLDLGFIRAGGEIVVAHEWDATACEAYPKVTGHNGIEQSDLAQYDLAKLPDADFIIGGPPCQDFSVAGHNAGADGERNLWSVALRAVQLKRPRYFVYENVPNLARRHKVYFRSLIDEFASFGYRAEWRILNAANYGVPQTRERVFLVGTLDGSEWHWPAKTHFKNAGWGVPRWISWYDALKSWVSDGPQPHYLPKWVLNKYPKQGFFDPLPDCAYFPLGNMRNDKQHREKWEPATTVTNGTHHVRRVKVDDRVYRLDERGAAILQTLPGDIGLKNTQIGNAVPPVLSEAIFCAAFAA